MYRLQCMLHSKGPCMIPLIAPEQPTDSVEHGTTGTKQDHDRTCFKLLQVRLEVIAGRVRCTC